VLRRALALTLVAVAFSAAGAFAFSPRVVHFWRAVGQGELGFERGFTAIPSSAADSARFATEGGVPGTFCPIPARSSEKPVPMPAAPSIGDVPLMSPAAPVSNHPNDSLLLAPQAKCEVPAPRSGGRPILP